MRIALVEHSPATQGMTARGKEQWRASRDSSTTRPPMTFCAHLADLEEDSYLSPLRRGSSFVNDSVPSNWLRHCTHDGCFLLLLDYSGYAHGVG